MRVSLPQIDSHPQHFLVKQISMPVRKAIIMDKLLEKLNRGAAKLVVINQTKDSYLNIFLVWTSRYTYDKGKGCRKIKKYCYKVNSNISVNRHQPTSFLVWTRHYSRIKVGQCQNLSAKTFCLVFAYGWNFNPFFFTFQSKFYNI